MPFAEVLPLSETQGTSCRKGWMRPCSAGGSHERSPGCHLTLCGSPPVLKMASVTQKAPKVGHITRLRSFLWAFAQVLQLHFVLSPSLWRWPLPGAVLSSSCLALWTQACWAGLMGGPLPKHSPALSWHILRSYKKAHGDALWMGRSATNTKQMLWALEREEKWHVQNHGQKQEQKQDFLTYLQLSYLYCCFLNLIFSLDNSLPFPNVFSPMVNTL